jgi:hypothetical protein
LLRVEKNQAFVAVLLNKSLSLATALSVAKVIVVGTINLVPLVGLFRSHFEVQQFCLRAQRPVGNCSCDQIHFNQKYEFCHTLLGHLSLTLFYKPT